MMNRKLSKIALMTMALALTACSPTVTTPPLPSPSGGPGVTPTASPSAGPSAQPTGQPTGQPSAAPSGPAASATPNPGDPVKAKPVVVSGMVYDEKGATVDGALITIRSLNAAAKYEATASTSAGSWVVNNVPEGVNVEVIATKAGWTTRKRVGSFQADAAQRNTVNFGASTSSSDAGAAYFISNRPEVEATVPVHKSENQDPGMLTYKLTLSEPLSETGRKRFEDALRVFPANDAASPNAAATDLESATDSGVVAVETAYDYVIKKGTTFLGDSATTATVTWNEAKTEATLSFKAPLIANDSTAAKYQVGLVAGTASDPAIEDIEGEQLGTSDAGSLTAYPAAGNLIRNVFKEIDLALEGSPASDAERWNATHDSVATFKVKKDELAPELKAVAVSTVGNDTRIALTFSEAMVAFDDTDGYSHASLADLAKYSFAVGEAASDLTLTLKGDAGAPNVNPGTEALYGDQAADEEKEFRLVDEDGTVNNGQSQAGDIAIEVDPRDAKVVWITIEGRENWFDSNMGAIKARVEGVGDPAGNAISDGDADKANVIGNL